MLYDNLDVQKDNLRENERRDKKLPRDTVVDEYDNNYRWNDENMGRYAALIQTIRRGLDVE